MTGHPIYTLRRGQCRFPITPFETDKHLFCAEPVEREGVVYCAEHAALCYDRRSEEKRRRDQQKAAIARAAMTTPPSYRVGPRQSEILTHRNEHIPASREDLA